MKVDTPNITPTASTSGKRYVTIPEFDLFDMQHPDICINHMHFGPGTHFLDKEVADTVEDRLKAYARGNVRILQPRRDTEAENLLNRGRGNRTTNF